MLWFLAFGRVDDLARSHAHREPRVWKDISQVCRCTYTITITHRRLHHGKPSFKQPSLSWRLARIYETHLRGIASSIERDAAPESDRIQGENAALCLGPRKNKTGFAGVSTHLPARARHPHRVPDERWPDATMQKRSSRLVKANVKLETAAQTLRFSDAVFWVLASVASGRSICPRRMLQTRCPRLPCYLRGSPKGSGLVRSSAAGRS